MALLSYVRLHVSVHTGHHPYVSVWETATVQEVSVYSITRSLNLLVLARDGFVFATHTHGCRAVVHNF